MDKERLPPIEVKKRLTAFAKEKRPSFTYYSDGSGFGSVMLKVIEEVLSSLEKRMEFRLVPESFIYGFAHEKGWRDLFMPFCVERPFNFFDNSILFMGRTLMRPFGYWKRWLKFYFSWRKLPYPTLVRNHSLWLQHKASLNLFDKGFLFMRKPLSWPHVYLGKVFRLCFSLRNTHCAMVNVIPLLPMGKVYTLPGYDRPLNYLEGGTLLLRELWHYTPEVEQEIQERSKHLKLLPKEYIAIHVRRGDKSSEASYTSISSYVQHIEALVRRSRMKKKVLFLMTDDYSVFGELKEALPGWEMHTLCTPDSKGNNTLKWSKSSPVYKRETRLLFLTELVIAKNAQYFFGTLSSCVFVLCALLRDPNTCFYVDKHFDFHPCLHEFRELFDAANPEAVALRRRVHG